MIKYFFYSDFEIVMILSIGENEQSVAPESTPKIPYPCGTYCTDLKTPCTLAFHRAKLNMHK